MVKGGSYMSRKLKSTSNSPLALNSIFDEGFKKGRTEGLKQGRHEGLTKGRTEGLKKGREEGLTKGREEGLKKVIKTETPDSVNLNIMNEWKNLKLLMVYRQQLNMLLIDISPYDAFKRKMSISQTNPFDKPHKKIDDLLFFYNVLEDVERNIIKSRMNLRKLYKNEVLNSKFGILFNDYRIVTDISHVMENSFIVPLSQLFEINKPYIKPYLTFLYYKFPEYITATFIKEASLDDNDPLDGLITQMLNYIDAENNTFAPIMNAIENNDVKGLQSAIESYIDSFPPIQVGAPTNVGVPIGVPTPVISQNSRKNFLRERKEANKAKTQKRSKSKSPKGTALPNGGVSL
jgi:hypothetical protein